MLVTLILLMFAHWCVWCFGVLFLGKEGIPCGVGD